MKRIPQNLKGKVALITGAAHGQGRAAALALADEGTHIIALDVAKQLSYPGYKTGDSEQLNSLAKEVESKGVSCLTYAVDVRDRQAVQNATKDAADQLGRIDILFNNAGICAYAPIESMSEEAWDTMLDINLKGAWIVAQCTIPYLKKQKDSVIINNSSVGGLRGMGRLSHYAAAKWGLTGLSKSMAIELAPYGIRVISIHPTGVNTPMNDGLASLEGKSPEEIAEASAGNLLPVPWIEPEDVAEAVVYLCSDKARYMTGNTFVLDAGLLTR